MRFSDRVGITKPPTPQVAAMNDDLRNSLWNLLLATFDATEQHSARWAQAAKAFASGFFKVPTDGLPFNEWDVRRWVKEQFYKLHWFEVYNLLEYVAPRVPTLTARRWSEEDFVHSVKTILRNENAGYRFIKGRLEPITNEAEIRAVEDALAAAQRSGLDSARAHLDHALRLLAQKPVPDYRNAIKEAISAVESAAKLIGKTGAQGLDGPLKELAAKTGMHPAMRDAFIKLYGYTSDSSGIRHAMLEAPNVDAADARFMVIACSAFVHFLIEKAVVAGLLKSK